MIDIVWAMCSGYRLVYTYFLGSCILIALLLSPLIFRRPRESERTRETLLTLVGLVMFAAGSATLSY